MLGYGDAAFGLKFVQRREFRYLQAGRDVAQQGAGA
jgi:hypothetical protein